MTCGATNGEGHLSIGHQRLTYRLKNGHRVMGLAFPKEDQSFSVYYSLVSYFLSISLHMSPSVLRSGFLGLCSQDSSLFQILWPCPMSLAPSL